MLDAHWRRVAAHPEPRFLLPDQVPRLSLDVMQLPEAMLYVVVHEWRVLVPILVLAVMLGKSWPSETWPSGDHGLLVGSVTTGILVAWLVLAALGHIFTVHLTHAFGG